MSQFNKTSDRLDKVEKAQAEPAAKIAKLNDAVDKLRAAPAAAPAACAASLPRKDGHRLDAARHVAGGRGRTRPRRRRPSPKSPGCRRSKAGCCATSLNGGALIEGRRGIYEVYAGDPVPGPRPRRCHPQAGRPLGGRDQQGPDRRALITTVFREYEGASPRREAPFCLNRPLRRGVS